MFLIIESGGSVEVCRPIAPNEPLDVVHHAQRYARAIGYALDTDNPGPTGLGADVDVTIRRTKRDSPIVWNSAGFHFAEGETE